MTLALLFDLDGTMVDTDPLHIAAWNAMLAPEGRAIDTAFYRSKIMGFDNPTCSAAVFPDRSIDERHALSEGKEAAFRAMLGRLDPTPGLADLLDWADARGVPKAVVTNAPRANAETMLRGLGWRDRFPMLVIGDELARGKPDPLPYLTGLERLGAKAGDAMAFEDSLSGMRACVAAGIESVGLQVALSADALRGAGASLVVRDFADPELWARLQARM